MTSPVSQNAAHRRARAASSAASYGHGGRSVHFKRRDAIRRARSSGRRLRALRIVRLDGVIGA
jgi:hypothetical protein